MEDSSCTSIKPLVALPPTKIAAKLLSLGKILFLLPIAALLAACPPPGGGGTPPATTYTTTVSGKVTTPAGSAVTQYDTATRRSVPSGSDAKVWASTASATKVAVAADGSYTLTVTHPGTFTLNVDYPAGRDYKAVAPQSVRTTATAHTQNVPLAYGYTTTVSGQVYVAPPSALTNGATVTARVEGRVVRSTTSSGTDVAGNPEGNYSITFDHPGTFRVTASLMGRRDASLNPPRVTGAVVPYSPVLLP